MGRTCCSKYPMLNALQGKLIKAATKDITVSFVTMNNLKLFSWKIHCDCCKAYCGEVVEDGNNSATMRLCEFLYSHLLFTYYALRYISFQSILGYLSSSCAISAYQRFFCVFELF